MPIAPPPQRHIVIDERNMLHIWLDEQIARHRMSPAEADAEVKRYETLGKLWTGPTKDMLGSGRIVYKLAKDMKSWSGARVAFVPGKYCDLVIIKGWPAGRKLLPGVRYRVDNPKIMELQIGKPGIRAAAKESARLGLVLVVAVDVGDYIMHRDTQTLGSLLGALSVDVPSVAIASIVGAAAGSAVAGTTVAGLATIGAIACGPMLVAFVVGVVVGYGLYKLDQHFGLTEKLSQAYDRGLAHLARAWHELGIEAQQRFRQLEHSRIVHDLTWEARDLARRLAREGDVVRGQLVHLW